MQDNFTSYIESRTQYVINQISRGLSKSDNLNWVLERLCYHINDTRSANFQKYYFETLGDKDHFLSEPYFFNTFKQQYSLQGIDNEYLTFLDNEKPTILTLIDERELSSLYLKYFAKAKIKHGKSIKEKDLASFFTKLVHTFLPDEYCALDNPIKNYFGLKNESFFMAFIIISNAYKFWLKNNIPAINKIRNEILLIDKDNILIENKLTNLKVLDLIFWVEANHFGKMKVLQIL
ncbi:MAG: hypothetical protein JWQ34_2125 [Mucilaginibacter sp.]|uniref:hypothetical protein n=1 Tax=Mucilaginibacter sp. TaxID=1882438 RepID=UPI00262AF016|nr:hypothetical protein [Mucilaginibacter sp.]MDB5003900.1 hypothetical protein [Mucilaginibacter sp.]